MPHLKSLKQLLNACYLFLAIALGTYQTAVGQNSINAAGNEAVGSGGIASYSIGQVIYTTNNGTNGSVAQGVQQPYEIYVNSVTDSKVGLSLTIYPNPTNGHLLLESNLVDHQDLSYQLHSANAVLIKNHAFGEGAQLIDMQLLPAAIYVLTINKKNQPIKTFKIIKK